MKRFVTATLLFGLFTSCAFADSNIYLCTDKDGKKEYRNTNIVKGCKKVDLPYLTTVPAPKVKKPETKKTGEAEKFPKVDKEKQKALDKERKEILQNELRAEQKKLDALKKEYKDGHPDRLGSERNYQRYLDRVSDLKENIKRTENNIDALNREIGSLD